MSNEFAVLQRVEDWLDETINLEMAQIDRLSRTKRLLQKVQEIRLEREEVREEIKRLEVEEERARHSRPWGQKSGSISNEKFSSAKLDPSIVKEADEAFETKGKAPGNKINETRNIEEDMSLLLPKQLDNILALAQTTRESKTRSQPLGSCGTSAKSTVTSSTTGKKSTSIQGATNLSDKHAKYKLMTPSVTSKNCSVASGKLPNPPISDNRMQAQKPEIRPLIEFVNTPKSLPTPADEVISKISSELAAVKYTLTYSPRFQALHLFEEELEHLGRFRVRSKVRNPTSKSIQTDKLFQTQIELLKNYKLGNHIWRGYASGTLNSLLGRSSYSTRRRFRAIEYQIQVALNSNSANGGDKDGINRFLALVTGMIQQEVRRANLGFRQMKDAKRLTAAQVRDLIFSFSTLQCWQEILSFPAYRQNELEMEEVCVGFINEEISLTQDALTQEIDRWESILLEGPKKPDKSKDNSLESLERSLLQLAAYLQVQVASVVKYKVFHGFIRYSVHRGIPMDINSRNLNRLICSIYAIQRIQNEETNCDIISWSRMRTLIRSDREWIEYLKLLKLTHSIIAHDASTLSSLVYVRKL
jgi:hypothetical protein